jgi:hypothetical protein
MLAKLECWLRRWSFNFGWQEVSQTEIPSGFSRWYLCGCALLLGRNYGLDKAAHVNPYSASMIRTAHKILRVGKRSV